MTHWSNTSTRLLLAQGDGLVRGNTVAVGGATVGAAGSPAILSVGRDEQRRRAVRLVPVDALSATSVAVGEELADDLGLRDVEWQISVASAVTAARIVLEPLTEGSLDSLSRQLSGAGDLAGQVCWLEPEGETAWIYAEGAPIRVRAAYDAAGHPISGMVCVGPRTELELFLSGNRTGVDIVILADCSGSMSWDDIADSGDLRRGVTRRGNGYLTRIDALKRALTQMLDIRMHVTGRVSRLALVRFTTTSRCVFPRQESMAEIQGPEDAAKIDQFRAAVGLLRPENAGTDIGQALHYASELLDRHGIPGNDRLIVLVSDGADWSRKDDKATGEALAATDDPVSLMEDLHEYLKINLHAVGIGEERSFHQWWDRHHRRSQGDPHISVIPNHRLLSELVKVGGGDPGRIGGLDVLEDYFSDLGSGIGHRIGFPGRVSLPPMQRTLIPLTEPRRTSDPAALARRRALTEEALQLRVTVSTLAMRCGEQRIFQKADPDELMSIDRQLDSVSDFEGWIMALSKYFEQALDSRLREEKPARPYGVPGVYELVRDGRLNRIRELRNYVGHFGAKPAKEAVVGAICQELVGTKFIQPNDGSGWTRLQLGLLAGLVGLLRDLQRLLEAAPIPEEAVKVATAGPRIQW